jgi:hypothetical protein
MGVDAGEERHRSAYGVGAKVDGGGGWVVPGVRAGRGRARLDLRGQGRGACG